MAIALAAVCWTVAAEESVIVHGFRLDDKHQLSLEQRHQVIRIGIATRARPVGNVPHTRTRDEGSDEVGRFGAVEYLAEVSSQVLRPSAPNYLNNPGERFRISVESLIPEVDYANVVEVDAGVARETMLAELERIRERVAGVRREALRYAGPFALQILSATDLLPAEIPTTVRESDVARIRVDDPVLQRRSIEANRKLYRREADRGPRATGRGRAGAGGTER